MSTRVDITQLKTQTKVAVVHVEPGIRISRCAYLVGVGTQAQIQGQIVRLSGIVQSDLASIQQVTT